MERRGFYHAIRFYSTASMESTILSFAIFRRGTAVASRQAARDNTAASAIGITTRRPALPIEPAVVIAVLIKVPLGPPIPLLDPPLAGHGRLTAPLHPLFRNLLQKP